MHKKMSSLFADMGKFLAFDPKKYSLDEMFGDIKAFIIQFKVSTEFKVSTQFKVSAKFKISAKSKVSAQFKVGTQFKVTWHKVKVHVHYQMGKMFSRRNTRHELK